MVKKYTRYLKIYAVLLAALLLLQPAAHAENSGRPSGIAGTIKDQGDSELNAMADKYGYPGALDAIPKESTSANTTPAAPPSNPMGDFANDVKNSAAAAAKSFSSWCDDCGTVFGAVKDFASSSVNAG